MNSAPRRNWWQRYLAFPLIYKLAIALVLGAVTGLVVGPEIAVIEPLGTIFLRLLQMMVIPVVVFTLVTGVSSGSAGQFGRVGVKIMVYYMLTTMVAITLGLALASLVQPGEGLVLPEGTESAPKEAPPLKEVLINIVPTNPVSAMVEGDMLAVLFFALVFGLALGVASFGWLWATANLLSGVLAVGTIAFAFPIWTFAVIAGAIWAENSWGRYWGWDPKETWAFITWVLYAAYLHAQATAGWRGRKAAWFALAGYLAFLFNFFGVNLWITGLHSYAGV